MIPQPWPWGGMGGDGDGGDGDGGKGEWMGVLFWNVGRGTPLNQRGHLVILQQTP